MVESFVYLEDGISFSGSCEVRDIARVRSAGGKFRELLSIITNQSVSMKNRSKAYCSCIRSFMLYGSEYWALMNIDFHRLQRNEHTMVWWICRVTVSGRIACGALLDKLGLKSMEMVPRINRLR